MRRRLLHSGCSYCHPRSWRLQLELLLLLLQLMMMMVRPCLLAGKLPTGRHLLAPLGCHGGLQVLP